MGKKFKIITNAISNEVSLCSKYNSGANKQTEFELVKNKEVAKDSNMKETLQKFIDMCGEIEQPCCAFHDFLNYWMQYDIDNTYYNLLSDALRSGIGEIQYANMPKEEKEGKFKELFNMFIEEFNKLPISKTQDGKYIVSLTASSHIKDEVVNPQNETVEITTKEKTGTMEKTEEMNIVEKAIDTIVTALGLKKTETPAEEQQEEKTEVTEEVVETPVEEAVEAPEATEEAVEIEKTEEVVEETVETVEEEAKPAEEETPVVEQVEETVEVQEEVETPEVTEEIAKTSEVSSELEELKKQKLDVERELAELKKANEEKEIAIEKMSFVQKAKDEFSMLVGTPEEIGATLYSISKSNLQDAEKEFILEQFKKVSKENKELTQEVGTITKNSELTDEDALYAKANEIAKSKGISVNKALREVK